MTIKQQLTEDMKTAMRNKEKQNLTIIRMIKNEIDKREIDQRKELSDAESIEAITSYKKTVSQQLEYAVNANNEDKIAEANHELSIINHYLPKQLSEAEVEAIIQRIITQHDFNGVKDKGNLMKLLMPELKGKTDGKVVSEIVSRLLG